MAKTLQSTEILEKGAIPHVHSNDLWLFRIFAEQDYLPDGFSGKANRGYDTHKRYVTQIDILYNPLRKLV